MGNLGEMTILIGREPGQSRLLIAIKANEQTKQGVIGQVGSVPKGVSRLKLAEGSAHCEIDIDERGTMILKKVNPNNVTYVDGVEVTSKRITEQSQLTLGSCRYPLNVSSVLATVQKIATPVKPSPLDSNVPPKQPSTVSIRHLKDIWDEYEKAIEDIQRRNQQKAKQRMLPIIIGSASSIAAPVFASLLGNQTLWITVPIAVVSFCIWIKIYTEKDTSIEDKKAANDKLMDKYVCPAKGCHHFMGYQPYKLLRQNKKCPYCGTLFSED